MVTIKTTYEIREEANPNNSTTLLRGLKWALVEEQKKNIKTYTKKLPIL